MSSGLSSVQTPFPERSSDRPAWHNDASLLAAVVKDLTTSTQPAVAFSSLAASCVPVLADECVIVIRELGNRQADDPAPFTIRYPTTPRPPTRRDPPRSTSQFESQSASGGASITVTSEVDGDGDEPGFVVTASIQLAQCVPCGRGRSGGRRPARSQRRRTSSPGAARRGAGPRLRPGRAPRRGARIESAHRAGARDLDVPVQSHRAAGVRRAA